MRSVSERHDRSRVRSRDRGEDGDLAADRACGCTGVLPGDIEFTTDGTNVNTTERWREVKLGIVSKRDRAEPATPDEWGDRKLPPAENVHGQRSVRRSLEGVGETAANLRGVGRRREMDLGGGAAQTCRERWAYSDVYHALESINDTSKKLFGDGSPAATI